MLKLEDYVSFDTAKMLNNAGFRQRTEYMYYNQCKMPSHAQVLKWLRDEHHTNIRVSYNMSEKQWEWDILDMESGASYSDGRLCAKYENATDDAIQFACQAIIIRKQA